MNPEEKLASMGLSLPAAPKPVAAYVAAVQTGNLIIVSGQLPFQDGKLACEGKVPSKVTIESAQQGAQICVLNALAVLKDQIDGDWSQFKRVVRVGAFVQSDDDFAGQPQVANGASEFLVELFGEAGKHARAAVGVNALPLNAAVEIEFTFEVN